MTEPRSTAEFEAFYQAHWGRLAGTLRLMSGDAMAADEVAQEAMTRAWMRWPRVAALDEPEGWVYVTAFRLMRKRLARSANQPAPMAVPEDVALDLTDRIALERALATLPVRQRQAVVARHVLGLDGPRAAALLGMRPDNFRQLLSRALRDLRVSPELSEPDLLEGSA